MKMIALLKYETDSDVEHIRRAVISRFDHAKRHLIGGANILREDFTASNGLSFLYYAQVFMVWKITLTKSTTSLPLKRLELRFEYNWDGRSLDQLILAKAMNWLINTRFKDEGVLVGYEYEPFPPGTPYLDGITSENAPAPEQSWKEYFEENPEIFNRIFFKMFTTGNVFLDATKGELMWKDKPKDMIDEIWDLITDACTAQGVAGEDATPLLDEIIRATKSSHESILKWIETVNLIKGSAL